MSIVNFWERYEMSYRAFSQHCDNNDWRSILEEIADQILAIKPSNKLSVLDVGSGTGKNIEEILEIILSKTHIVSTLDIVEPSSTAVQQLKQNLLRKTEGGFLRSVFSNLVNLTTEQYDIIIFMHSSYYITDLSCKIQHLIKYNLKAHGKIIILSLASDSQFFLNISELVLPNTADTIKLHLVNENIKFYQKQLNSKFHYTDDDNSGIKQSSFFYEFMTERKIHFDDFAKALNWVAIDGNLNFKDELITISI